MTDADAPHDHDIVALLNEQRHRHARLQERQRLARIELERHRRELEEARAAARAAFGTDDVGALKRLLEEKRRRNAELVDAFRSRLDEVERALEEAEARTAASAPSGSSAFGAGR